MNPPPEKAVFDFIFDHPGLVDLANFHPHMFAGLCARWLMAELLNLHAKFQVVPTRHWLKDHIETKLTVDDPYEEIFELLK